MAISKRIILFVLVNILIIATISIVTNLFGIRPYLNQYGIDYRNLAIFCLIWGFGGAFISLGLSRIMAKWMMRVKIIDPQGASGSERQLLETVHRLAAQAGLSKMPQVGIYPSPEVNAFATGPTKSRSLVAVSAGLLQRMSTDQVEGVLGHEIAHVANGDMVTMTLLQGVINAFVMFIARVIAFAASQFVREEGRIMIRIVVTIALDILLSILGAIVVSYFSRIREYRADRGGARFTGRQKMIGALEALKRNVDMVDMKSNPSLNTFKISSKKGGFLSLFASHPPLDERIRRLKEAAL